MDTTATPAAAPGAVASDARTPTFSLSPAAVTQVKQVIKEQAFEGFYLTIRVVPAGCSGLGYDLNLMKDAKPGDVVWEQDGVKICTDQLSVQYLNGTTVDYVAGPTASGFKFTNPNAKSTCGCGTSFST